MKYLTGSKYFFSNYSDFIAGDIDYIELIASDSFFITNRISNDGIDIFQINLNVEKSLLLDIYLNRRPPMSICSFLTKEVSEELNITIDDLKSLKPLADRCTGKHSYLKMIYDFYIENNSFTLTDEQRLIAYEDYKSYHPEIYKKEELK